MIYPWRDRIKPACCSPPTGSVRRYLTTISEAEQPLSGGLGSGIVEVLARQLGGWAEVTTGAWGTTVSVLSADPGFLI